MSAGFAPIAPAHRSYSRPRARKLFAANSRSPRRRSYCEALSARRDRKRKCAAGVAQNMSPIHRLFRFAGTTTRTEETVPALPQFHRDRGRHADIPESRSLPATILASGPNGRASFSKIERSSPSRSRREKLRSDLLRAAKTRTIFVTDPVASGAGSRAEFSRLYDCALGHQRPRLLRSSTSLPRIFSAPC